MGPQRYERVANDDVEHQSPISATPGSYPEDAIPASPPPSFRSRASSPTGRHLLADHDPLRDDAERTLDEAFDSPSDDEDDGEGRTRLINNGSRRSQEGVERSSGTVTQRDEPQPGRIQRQPTELPAFTPQNARRGKVYGAGNASDGVFANLSAKPQRGDNDPEEKPPTYEQAAADATPPYWETTIMAPGLTSSSDEVYVDGLPVGGVASFIWNMMISMTFQIVGFLLTYLLHTTHAAKNGSRAGLGVFLIQYGFSMKGMARDPSGGGMGGDPGNAGEDWGQAPTDPNSHDFDPNAGGAEDAAAAAGAITTNEMLAYALMIVGWFILIRAISDFVRARKHQELVLQSPSRGLNVPVVAEGEGERAA